MRTFVFIFALCLITAGHPAEVYATTGESSTSSDGGTGDAADAQDQEAECKGGKGCSDAKGGKAKNAKAQQTKKDVKAAEEAPMQVAAWTWKTYPIVTLPDGTKSITGPAEGGPKGSTTTTIHGDKGQVIGGYSTLGPGK